MKRIALIVNSAEWVLKRDSKNGGGNVVANNLYNVLKNDNKVVIICSGNKNSYQENNLEVIYINYPIYNDKFLTEALKIAETCDKTISLLSFKACNGMLIQTHSYEYKSKLTNKLLIPIKKFLYRKKIAFHKYVFSERKVDYAYAVSNNIKEDYEKNLGLNNIKVSYPGCKQVYEEFLPSENKKLTFGLVSGLSINKSSHYCILILGIAKLLGLKFDLKIVSLKYDKDFLLKFLIKLFNMNKDTEIFANNVNMDDFYKKINCVIMPSKHESFGLVPLEALSFCKTCLVTNTIGFAEIIDENSGFKFNRNSFFSFLFTLFKIQKLFYKDKYKFNEICKNGFEISKNYTWENFVKGLID